MDNNYQDLLRVLEHQNQADAQWLLWQREGHRDGYPSLGSFWFLPDGRLAIGEKTPVKVAHDTGAYWGPTMSFAKAWKAACANNPELQKSSRDKLPFGHIDFYEAEPNSWRFRVHLPSNGEISEVTKTRIRLAFHLPEASTVFIPLP